MKHAVRRVKDLKLVLKDLERCIKSPDYLRKGREFKSFALRPREVLTNWLLCAVLNFEDGDNEYSFATDPTGGDGTIVRNLREGIMQTEHVFIPPARGGHARAVEELILKGIYHKQAKGRTYAQGKELIVFSEASGVWLPNRIARKIRGSNDFRSVWVVHLESVNERNYTYCIAKLDLTYGDSPAWKVLIPTDFSSWRVERRQ